LLVGGNANSIILQPLSVQGQTGLNVAAGVAGLSLTLAGRAVFMQFQRDAPVIATNLFATFCKTFLRRRVSDRRRRPLDQGGPDHAKAEPSDRNRHQRREQAKQSYRSTALGSTWPGGRALRLAFICSVSAALLCGRPYLQSYWRIDGLRQTADAVAGDVSHDERFQYRSAAIKYDASACMT
jgi:hypothetical protein